MSPGSGDAAGDCREGSCQESRSACKAVSLVIYKKLSITEKERNRQYMEDGRWEYPFSEAKFSATASAQPSGQKGRASSSGKEWETSHGGEQGWANRGATSQDHARRAASLQQHFPLFPAYGPAGPLWFCQRWYPKQGIAATGTMQEPT